MQATKNSTHKSTLLTFSIITVICTIWALFYHVLAPLTFYSYFSDPELAYIFSALELSHHGVVELTDHPGTFLQLSGALITRILSINFNDAFNPDAIHSFRSTWLIFSAFSTLGSVLLLRKLTVDSLSLFSVILLLFHDYHTLAFWGRFTPEGAFSILYLPIILIAFSRFTRPDKVSWKSTFTWGILLGCATTTKITLWPVTAFLWVLFACARNDTLLKKSLLLAATSILSYLILGSLFADNRSEQINWFLSLIHHSGRYGGSNTHGAFLPINEIIERTCQGLSLQSYTTLLPPLLLTGVAAIDLLKKTTPKRNRLIAAGFILCMALNALIYAKHPYQIKYLLPQTYLMVLFFVYRIDLKNPTIPDIAKKFFMILLCGVTLNALTTYHALHAYTRLLDTKTQGHIDRSIKHFDPKMLYFSLEVHSPLTAQGFAVREIKRLAPLFKTSTPPSMIFRERAANYSILNNSPLPLTSIAPHSLIFTKRSFSDPRVESIFHDNDLGLYIFYCPEGEFEPNSALPSLDNENSNPSSAHHPPQQ